MNIRHMYPKKYFDAEDLRDFAGDASVPVTIERVDYKTANSTEIGEARVDWFLYVHELKKPIKIGARSGFQLGELLGEETEGWVGRVVGIRAGQYEAYGKWRWGVEFYHVGDRKPTLAPKTDISGYGAWTPEQKQRLTRALPPGSGAASAAGAAAVSSPPIGAEAAAKIVVALRERGLGWEDLIASCRKQGAEDLIVGKEPVDCPAALADVARVYCALHPRTSPVDDFAAEVAKLVQVWAPPPAGINTDRVVEVVDRTTGEVIDTSDIPF